MPTKFRVEVIEQVALPSRPYRITLEIEQKVIPVQRPVKSDEVTVAPAAFADFLVAAAGKGRLTIDKARPLTSRGTFPLEDSYEYAVEFTGSKDLTFRLIGAVAGPIACPNPPKGAKPATPEAPKGAIALPPELQLGKDKDGSTILRVQVGDPPDASRKSDREVSSAAGVARWRPIAHVFPGTEPNRRALIFAGIHATEPHGTRVANQLLALLRGRGQAKVTVVLIPFLFPRTHGRGDQVAGDDRNVPSAGDRRNVEPNRNFPMAGQSYATARDLGRQRKDAPELVFCADGDVSASSPRREPKAPSAGKKTEAGKKTDLSPFTSHRLLPETGLLLALIEDYRPSLIVTLHAHSRSREVGNSSGIFVDPRPEQRKADMDLAAAMVAAFDARYQVARRKVEAARASRDAGVGGGTPDAGSGGAGAAPAPEPTFTWDPLTGNRPAKAGDPVNVLYAVTAAHPPGTSMGDWSPIRVSESFPGVASPRGNRPGIPDFTIECPQTRDGRPDPDSPLIESTHAEVIFEVLLEGPGVR